MISGESKDERVDEPHHGGDKGMVDSSALLFFQPAGRDAWCTHKHKTDDPGRAEVDHFPKNKQIILF